MVTVHLFGELVGVAYEVQQRLPQPHLVGMHRPDRSVAMDRQLVAVLCRQRFDCLDDLVDQRWQSEGVSPPRGAPACPSRASGWSSPTTPRGFPCCVRFPCVHAAATTPAQRLGVLLRSFTQPCQPSPKGSSGRPAHRPFRGLLGVHSRYGLHTRAVTNS